jgi:hypothetical protein
MAKPSVLSRGRLIHMRLGAGGREKGDCSEGKQGAPGVVQPVAVVERGDGGGGPASTLPLPSRPRSGLRRCGGNR